MKVILELLRYGLVHLLPSNYYSKKLRKKVTFPNVFISMTTIESRINSLKPTINSILDQSILPEKIIVNLAIPDHRKIPSFLKHPIININIIEKDLGPATKLLPTLKIVPHDSYIIVLDDDQIYPNKLVANYVANMVDLPDCALCMVGWKLPRNLDHINRKQLYGAKFRLFGQGDSVELPEEVEILQGASSYAVRPLFFDEKIFDYSTAPKSSYFVDDIWVSGHLSINKIKKYVIPAEYNYCRLSNARVASETGLVKTVNKEHNNNNELYRYFEKHWRLTD